MFQEKLTVNARPNQAAISVDVDFGHAKFRRALELGGIHAPCAREVAAGSINARHLFLRHRAGTVHHQRKTGQTFLDLRQHVKMERLRARKLERAMAGADGDCQGIAATAFNEFARLFRIGQFGFRFADRNVFFHAAEHAQLRLDNNTLGMGSIHNALRDGDILIKRLAAGINHHRAVKSGFDAVIASGFIAVVKMHRENSFLVDLIRRADKTLEESLVGITARALADLDDERRLRIQIATEQAYNLLEIVDVIGANGIFAIGMLE